MTIKVPALDGVEAWSANPPILGPGTHPVTVLEETPDETGDHPVVMLQLEAIGGEEPGGQLRDWIHITKNTLGGIKQLYEAFGVDIPEGEFAWIPLKDRNANAIVAREPKYNDPSKTISRVKAYAPLPDADLEAARGASPTPSDDESIPF